MLFGMWEMVLVCVVALIVLGPEKMPDAARKLARALSQMRRIADEVKQNFDDVWVEPQHDVHARPAPQRPLPAPNDTTATNEAPCDSSAAPNAAKGDSDAAPGGSPTGT